MVEEALEAKGDKHTLIFSIFIAKLNFRKQTLAFEHLYKGILTFEYLYKGILTFSIRKKIIFYFVSLYIIC